MTEVADYGQICDLVFSDCNKVNEMRAASQSLFLKGEHAAALESSRGIAVTTIHMLNTVQNIKHHDLLGSELAQKAEAVKANMLSWIRAIKAGPASENATQASDSLEISLKDLLGATSQLMVPAPAEEEEEEEEEGDRIRITLTMVKNIRDVGQELVDVIKRENEELTFPYASKAFQVSVKQLVDRFLKFGFREAAHELTDTSNAVMRIGMQAQTNVLTDPAQIDELVDEAVSRFTSSLKHGVLRLTQQQAAQQASSAAPTDASPKKDFDMPAVMAASRKPQETPGWRPSVIPAVKSIPQDMAKTAESLVQRSSRDTVTPAQVTTPKASTAPPPASQEATRAPPKPSPIPTGSRGAPFQEPAAVEAVFDIVRQHFADFDHYLRKHHKRDTILMLEQLDRHLIGNLNTQPSSGGLVHVYLRSLGPVGDLARSITNITYTPLVAEAAAHEKLSVVQSLRGLLALLPEITFAVINNAIGHAFSNDPLSPSGEVLKQSLDVFYEALLQVVTFSRQSIWNANKPRMKRKGPSKVLKPKTSDSSEGESSTGSVPNRPSTESHPSRPSSDRRTSGSVLSPTKDSKKSKKVSTRKRRDEKKSASSVDSPGGAPPASPSVSVTYSDKSRNDIFEDMVVYLKERLNKAKEVLPKGSTEGEVNPASKAAALSEANAMQTVQTSEKLSVFRHARGVNALVSQLCVTLDALSFTPHLLDEQSNTDFDESNIPSVLQLIECCLQVVVLTECHQVQGVTGKLLNAAETHRYLVQNAQQLREVALGSKLSKVVDIEDMFEASGAIEANIWDDTIQNGQVRDLNPEEVRKRGTLNELVEMLCSDTHIDNTFTRTFLTTYRAFTTPTELFEKLMQRWHCPPEVGSERGRAIQLRVGITLKYWIEHQSRDFDTDLRVRMNQFLDKTVISNQVLRYHNPFPQAQSNLGRMLKGILEKQAVELELKGQFEYRLERVTHIDSDGRPLASYFLALEDAEIARQMTLIEYRLFSAIGPSELLNQSWNKKKLQYRASNVRALIERANRVINWIGNMIAWGQTKRERAALFSKFIRVAQELFRINNINTLMSVIGALNSASIKRLQATKALVAPALMDSFRKLDDLLQSTGSYKQYREHLHSISPPLLPYMGVYLTDLTFIEDATPDMFDTKAEEILLEIEQYQQTKYEFPISEPAATFLYDLPCSSDNDLYTLSTTREPRNCNPDEVQ